MSPPHPVALIHHPEASRGSLLESKTRESAAADTIRVGVNLLDKLMTLVGELVLARNQLLQVSNTSRDAGLQTVSQRMNLIATELQEEVMKTRMQPIGNIWSQFPRTVRDVALGCGKQVNIEMEGKETELDKTIIEAIKDPLTHLVRNSVDHGIELPEDRVKAGKDSGQTRPASNPSPSASSRSRDWSSTARPTAKSPPSSISARRRSRRTCATSSANSTPTPASTSQEPSNRLTASQERKPERLGPRPVRRSAQRQRGPVPGTPV